MILQFHLPGSNSLSCKPVNPDGVYTIKSFKTNKYLKVKWKNNATKLSFTGNPSDCGIYFVPKGNFTKRAFSLYDKTDYYLAVKHGKMVVKKMNPSRRQLGNECLFQTRRINLNYSRGENNNVSEKYKVLVSWSTNNSKYNAIKSNKFGKISLGNWKDCRAWFDIKPKKKELV